MLVRERVAAAALLSVLTLSQAALAVDGERDHSSAFTVAVALGAPSNPELRCSGVLIDSELVLTVRHCVETLDSPDDVDCANATFMPGETRPQDLWVTAARDIHDDPATWRKVRSAMLPDTTRVCGSDLALLRLEQPIDSNEATPAELAVDERAFETAIATGFLGAVGYGSTAPGLDDAGVRRGRWDIPILCVRGDRRFSCADHVDSTVPLEFVSGPASCAGDSGSGAIDIDDRTRVFGVLSRGAGQEGQCPRGIYERTDAWAWLIGKSLLAVAAERKLPEAPSWATALFPAAGAHAAVGSFCRQDSECEDGASCLSVDDARSFVCASACETDAQCPDNFGCLADGGPGHCFAGVEAKSTAQNGCAVAHGRACAGAEWVVAGLGLARLARRRPRRLRVR